MKSFLPFDSWPSATVAPARLKARAKYVARTLLMLPAMLPWKNAFILVTHSSHHHGANPASGDQGCSRYKSAGTGIGAGNVNHGRPEDHIRRGAQPGTKLSPTCTFARRTGDRQAGYYRRRGGKAGRGHKCVGTEDQFLRTGAVDKSRGGGKSQFQGLY